MLKNQGSQPQNLIIRVFITWCDSSLSSLPWIFSKATFHEIFEISKLQKEKEKSRKEVYTGPNLPDKN